MIALGFTLYPPSPAAPGLLFLVALFWPGCQLFVNTMDDDEQRTYEPPRTARSEALGPY
jgi:hypothetical protein